ncbi:methyltransferase, TIGR00027 family protein [Mycobacterium kansasii 732]|uniref:class I SAM-dependent methyltransferase n=1 Tax=Mycobacterium pseudokansasii TaxID=2341080 RepID=UPI0004498BBB|nr:class I SAM-dependent methyltransferase [Mycobacterium pseudokansasii]EUA06512.1 methyltransferase, TIGR00027 family protein [Mycobacterium kansasii 732]KZS62759.1 SAM-dependent methyltransferase [Mycobacterium kansasii]VAZ95825.1 Putative S-adenosyl-L-methionine-dependent methyltransferase [Mycobacterium pseudokansasii]VAZ97162.1 Putative S-adenosyl-L-methionine-dependent methyltransferase [Mycobacterium pseudokansasii]
MTTPEFGSLRSDDDQWDIVSSVGYTALLVAGWRALHAVGPHPLVHDEYAKQFVDASGDPYLSELLANPVTSGDQTAFPRLYGVQTRFFDDFFRSAADAGLRQAVIVAAGLDSRSYRLEWPSGTTVFEIDLPKVLEFKARVLAQRDAEPKAHRTEVAADLRTDWPKQLKTAGFDPRQPSAWSMEGLLMYLTGEAQDALFARIDELSAPGSRVAVGALGTRLDHQQLAALEATHPGVNLSGNVDFSALSYDDKTNPAEWLADRGWVVGPVRNTLELQAGYGMTPPEVDVQIDSFMHSQYITATKG